MSRRSAYIRFVICVAVLMVHTLEAKAQAAFSGIVTDADTGEPVEMATVQLLRGSGNALVSYTLTDMNGAFSLQSPKLTDSLSVCVSLLGYQTQVQSAVIQRPMLFKLEPKLFSLREVEIRPGRVWGRQDTINYDISRFLSAKDESIKDVIGKLPGIDVDALGRISYNGRSISNFYVEGLDLTDGKYGRIANNLDARAVETVQVLENHQPIRLLKEKVKVEDVAINLRLKPEFRDKWMVSIRGAAGFSSEDFFWEGSLDALQLSRKSQSAYLYKGNNSGEDVTDEQQVLVEQSANQLSEPAKLSFLSQPSMAAPLNKERWLFNDVHTLSANRLRKINENTQLRITAGYTHDLQRQERGSETTYYRSDDTIRISEDSHTRIRSDIGEIGFSLEENSADRYLTNHFNAYAERRSSLSDYTTGHSFRQRIKTNDIGLRNDLRSITNRDNHTYEVRSLLRYNYSPASLQIDSLRQPMNVKHFYTDNSFSFFRKRAYLSQRYTIGMTGQTSNLKNGLSAYLTPNWQAVKDKWLVTLTTPLVWTGFPSGDFSRLSLNPSLVIQYKYNYAWRFTLYGSYREQYGDLTDFYALPYQIDYRNTVRNTGSLTIQRMQNYSAYGEYKNTIREFFASITLAHHRAWSNRIYEQLFDGEQVVLASRQLSNDAYGWTLRGVVSKGFYDWNMKASLNYQLGMNKAEQLSEGERLPYRSSYIQYEPKLSWSPNVKWETSYQGNFRYRGSKIGGSELAPLWNFVQKINVSYSLFPFELNLSADHYYNDVSSAMSVNAFLMDASVRIKHCSWQFDVSVDNIFNKKQYSYTRYSSLESYTSWVNIRGREMLLSARYKF